MTRILPLLLINQFVSFFYFIGFWPTLRELKGKLFFSIYYSLFFVSLVAGAIGNENEDTRIFLTEIAVGVAVLTVKFLIFIWKQNRILHLLNRICVCSIQDDEDLAVYNRKLSGLIRISILITIASLGCAIEMGVVPLFRSEKALIMEVGFPLDYRNSEIAFYIADIFVLTEVLICLSTLLCSVIIWYLLLSCSLRYEVLGSEMKKMGRINAATEGNNPSKIQAQKIFFQDLKSSIDSHLRITELTMDLESFFSMFFLLQFATSGLCICGSVYCLAFDVGDDWFERSIHLTMVCYYISELFMITYFGNEIMLTSDRLSYSLFESDWTGQPQAVKMSIIIFGEYLKQPHVFVIGKLYSLTLETFTQILNSAYSMFNILKNLHN
ncbi:odorant receptor 94b-like [Bradysia coprophila]|uniref:odorant receptor 94b-like n=1 Tax=Bradysia coprophila TaxID=38358 RepID=UPI00187DB376|nr:odorant receptor 94b-like [Bradysia coprophila]